MGQFSRRGFLQSSAVGGLLTAIPGAIPAVSSGLSIAPFRFDVTAPNGHGCCGGWIKPIEAVDDTQEAIGYVLLGAGAPIVVCAVDWTGILNSAHVAWRTAMAEAAGTTPERCAVQCVHQHNAPFACLDAQKLVDAQGDLPNIMLPDFFAQCLDRLRKAIAEAIPQAVPVTHVGHGRGRVEQVASNRRINRGPDGRIVGMRGSACADPKLRELTEGLIDPDLRTVAFYSGDRAVVCCHYYAVHPMSYYGDGRASSDFPGLARKQRQAEEPAVTHIYFTGCAGNIAAGKYNDGTKPMRAILARRIYDGMVAAAKDLRREPVGEAIWKTADVLPAPRADLNAEALAAMAVMSHTTGRWASRLVVPTSRRRPLPPSMAILSSRSCVTYFATSALSGLLSVIDEPKTPLRAPFSGLPTPTAERTAPTITASRDMVPPGSTRSSQCAPPAACPGRWGLGQVA